MRKLIPTLLTAFALPLVAVAQTDQQQQTQEQSKETQKSTTTKGKKMHAPNENRPDAASSDSRKSEPNTNMRGQMNEKNRSGQDVNRSESGTRSSMTNEANVRDTNQKTTVNKQEFRTRHEEVFKMGRHPREFFVQRYGANHFRLIGGTYFVFVDSCWVAVDVDGFAYSERMICPGDADYVLSD